ncbi:MULTISPECIES: hypothetical protein [unclassified Pseudomonas]|nr:MULTISPECIES: hypothetical protein [unclassified Pseudomonas]
MRNPTKKKRVYREVLTEATKKQNEVMLAARIKYSAVGAGFNA